MKNLTILIYLKSRMNSKGENPIYMRVTVDGKRKETSLNRSIASKKWDKNKQRGKGNTEEIRILNEFLLTAEHEILMARQVLVNNNVRVTVETLTNKYLNTVVHNKDRIYSSSRTT